ncbi:hypothetical protein C8R43DRAFT_688352 [Mycena crocata]|nr:hypothetical protein C8R43DRAFT_688352 [Mycena crocata]
MVIERLISTAFIIPLFCSQSPYVSASPLQINLHEYESPQQVPHAEISNVIKLLSSRDSSTVKSVTIGASVAIIASAFLLAVTFIVLWRRLRRKRQYKVESGRAQRPVLPRIGTDFPAEMKPAYLDSPRSRRSSIIADPLSPLAASQKPGFVPRPIPANIPMSVSGSTLASMHFNPHAASALGVSPDDLAEILDELSRHYILTDPSSPGPWQSHQHSTSLTGRSRAFQAYS